MFETGQRSDVTVSVGVDKKAFSLHSFILTTQSKFFEAAFYGNFNEAKTKEIFLPDIDTETFKILMEWMYGGDSDIRPSYGLEDTDAVVSLYRAADFLIIPALKRSILCYINVAVRRRPVLSPHQILNFTTLKAFLCELCLLSQSTETKYLRPLFRFLVGMPRENDKSHKESEMSQYPDNFAFLFVEALEAVIARQGSQIEAMKQELGGNSYKFRPWRSVSTRVEVSSEESR
ncbi:hypothetical protein AA313_de0207077 [Arthrobotrys entomopaga]|nr:hypothetical protein AA313_de0207077 [Arthrobotrys entomopaga]